MFNQKKQDSFLGLGIIREPFEFMSPLALEDCAERLRSKSEPTRLFSFKNPLKVEVTQLDPDTYQFKMQRDAGRNLVVEAMGILERTDEGTYVSGRGQLSRFTLVLTLIIMVVQFPIFAPTFGLGILALDGLLLAIFWVVMASARHSLVRLLPNALGTLDGYMRPSHSSHQQYKESGKNRLLEIIGIGIVALFFLSAGSSMLSSRSREAESCAIKPAQARLVLSSDISLQLLWVTRLGIGAWDHESGVAIGDGKLFAQNCSDITAFDIQTGHQLWVAEKTAEWADGVSGQLTVDEARHRVYALKSLWGLRAFSMTDGKLLWTSGEKLFERASPSLELTDKGDLYAYNDRGWWQIDPDTGNLKAIASKSTTGTTSQIVEGIALTKCTLCLKATDSRNNVLLWSFASGSNELVSNAVVHAGKIYIMDQQAKVFILDLHTGHILSAIQFEFPKNQENLLYAPGQIGGSLLAVHERFLAVYFADTQVLSVYEMPLP